jgi:hypothetical protein
VSQVLVFIPMREGGDLRRLIVFVLISMEKSVFFHVVCAARFSLLILLDLGTTLAFGASFIFDS